MVQLWPPTDTPRTLTRQVWDATTARSIPGVARALGVLTMPMQCSLQDVKAGRVRAVPSRFLQRPDPDMALPTYLQVHIEDYLLHGNAAHLVTSLDAEGYPATTRWYPAHAWNIVPDERGQPVYHLYGTEVARDRVVHVRRGADPAAPWRGQGVVEQHIKTLDRAGLESEATRATAKDRGMPAVAVIKPTGEPDPVADQEVADKWVDRYSGTDPKPGIFPNGTQIIPLAWNPTDQQLVQARELTLKELANAFNLDSYWLGASASSHTYRSPGPLFLALLRTSIEPILAVLEDEWSWAWLPYGRRVRLDRVPLLRDDLGTMVTTYKTGREAGLWRDANEFRAYMGWPELAADELPEPLPATPPPAPSPTPDDEPDETDPEENPA